MQSLTNNCKMLSTKESRKLLACTSFTCNWFLVSILALLSSSIQHGLQIHPQNSCMKTNPRGYCQYGFAWILNFSMSTFHHTHLSCHLSVFVASQSQCICNLHVKPTLLVEDGFKWRLISSQLVSYDKVKLWGKGWFIPMYRKSVL